jgi:hypothetical protein
LNKYQILGKKEKEKEQIIQQKETANQEKQTDTIEREN